MLHAALLLAVFLGFYKLLLQKETFYSLNRAVLLACISICFLLPLFKISAVWSIPGGSKVLKVFESRKIEPASLPATIGDSSLERVAASKDTRAAPLDAYDRLLNWTWYLYWFGVAAFGISFILQLVVLLYTVYSKPSIIDGKFRIVELNDDKTPCSFFNIIFINPEKYDWETYNAVLNHEKIHAAQGHSLDIMLTEIALVFQWFNPFAWLYRKELESNLEYLTDEAVLKKAETDKAVYQASLLKVAVPQLALRLTANYNQSLLKKRLMRMDIKKSNLHTLWKYAFLLPLCFVLVCAFNSPESTKNGSQAASQKNNGLNPLYSMTSDGLWYATLEAHKVNVYLRPTNAGNQSSAQLVIPSALMRAFIKGSQEKFELSREAGTMILTGEFDEGKGLGQYQFVPDKKYKNYVLAKGISDLNAHTQLACFFLDITREYVNLAFSEGISVRDLISQRSNEINKESNIKNQKSRAYKSFSNTALTSPRDTADSQMSNLRTAVDRELESEKRQRSSTQQERIPPPSSNPEVLQKIREEALKRALTNTQLDETRRIQAEKHARQQWKADSLKKLGKNSKGLKVEMPIVIKVESKTE